MKPRYAAERRRRRVQQAVDALAPFAGALGGAGGQVVAAGARMGVQHEDRRRFALQRVDQPDQQRVLHAVGETAGVEGVAVVHRTLTPGQAATLGGGRPRSMDAAFM